MVILDLSRIDRKAQDPLELESYLFPFWSHSKPQIKAQLERPKRPTQLDNLLDTKGETYRILIRYINVKWCVCMSRSHSIILPWKLIERSHFLSVKWN